MSAEWDREITTPGDPKWLAYARTLVGKREGMHDAWIASCFALCGMHDVDDSKTAWCSAGMNGIMHDVGIPGTGKANARSWLTWGVSLSRGYHGCVVVLSRPPLPWQGHVSLLDLRRIPADGCVSLLGCNQRNMVCDADYAAKRAIAYRWPAGEPLPIGEAPT